MTTFLKGEMLPGPFLRAVLFLCIYLLSCCFTCTLPLAYHPFIQSFSPSCRYIRFQSIPSPLPGGYYMALIQPHPSHPPTNMAVLVLNTILYSVSQVTSPECV